MTDRNTIGDRLRGLANPAGQRSRNIGLMLACAAVAIAVAGAGLGDEAVLSLHKDTPRHMMNGVFVMDMLHDRPVGSFTEMLDYARHYFARYPALSIGHHPPLPAVLNAPGFALFDVSVAAARIPSIVFLVIAMVFLFRLVTDWFDHWSGAAAALVLVTSPQVSKLALGVMDEIPALMFLIMSGFYLHRFVGSPRNRTLAACVILLIASAWCKQLALSAAPAFAAYVAWRLGWRRLLRADLLVAGCVAVLMLAPLVPLTARFAPYNVEFVTRFAAAAAAPSRLAEAADALLAGARSHLIAPLWALAALGLASLWLRNRGLFWVLSLWILGTVAVVGIFTVSAEPDRYGIYWLPAWAACVGALCAPDIRRRYRFAPIVVGVSLAVQLYYVVRPELPRVEGYEAVARYVVDHPLASTTLFVGDMDSGYFTFFVRKHDRARRAIVLRADKVLTTSHMWNPAAHDHVAGPGEIPGVLERLGVGYVVAEDWPSASRTLNWLLDDLKSERFAERLRVRIRSTDRRIHDAHLVVYEVIGARPAHPEARLDLRLPLVSESIGVSIDDLLKRKFLR